MNGAQNEQQQGTYQDAQINQGPPIPPQGQPGAYGAGYGTQPKPNFNRKSPAMATWLSLMPGLGQIYVGYYQQGFINMFVVAGTITALASSFMRGAEPFFGVFLSFFWIFQMIDANRRAHHYNRVMAGLGGEDVPDGFSMPTTKGSMLGGGVLVILGILFIMDLNFDVSMEWVENWWPMILVLVGVYLIFKARKNAD
jgi:hypothetical protein